jgi:mRNA interferase MazF
VKRGEIYWFRFPSPDKKRPVVVLTRSALVGHLNAVTVASITSTRRGVPSEVPLGPEEGLPRPCAVNLHNVFTLQKSELGPFMVALGDEAVARIDRALIFALGVGERQGRSEPH